MEDIYNKSMWKPCCLVERKFTAFKIESGAAYINTRDGSITKATPQTPMVVKDDEGVLWTESVQEFCLHYKMLDGRQITQEYLSNMEECVDFEIVADTSQTWYAFHVLPSKYGFDCPLGANKSDAYNGDGDYFICKRINNLRLQDIKILRTETFNVLYKTKEEIMGTFEFKDSKWYWDGQEYKDQSSAVTALCDDIVESKGSLLPVFKDLGNSVDVKLQLIWAIYNQNDMESYLVARTDSQFEKMTRTKFGPGSRQNKLCAKLFRLPMTYESNRVMQVALFPALEKVYSSNKRSVETAVGKYSFEKTFSYICDDVLFALGDSPFDKWLNMLSVLDNFEPTRNLSSTMMHSDLERLQILSMQVKEDDIPVDCTISIGDVRKCRYPSKTKDKLGDMDYVDSLLCSPPAVHCDNFYEWVNKVFGVKEEVDKVQDDFDSMHFDEPEEEEIDESKLPWNNDTETAEEKLARLDSMSKDEALERGMRAVYPDDSEKDIARKVGIAKAINDNFYDIDLEEEVTQEPVKITQESLSNAFKVIANSGYDLHDISNMGKALRDEPVCKREDFPINKPEEQDIIPMHNVAYVYCNMAGANFDSCLSTLRAMGIEGWENFYRALPIYLRRMNKGVFEGALTEYCNILKEYYGSCELRFDV